MTDFSTFEKWVRLPSRQEAAEFYERERFDEHIAFLKRGEFRAVVWGFDEATLPVVRRLHEETGLPICPIVPDMASFARDTRDKGFVGAALDRFKRLSPGGMIKVCAGAAPQALRVAQKDFSTGLCLLAEMELARCRSLAPTAAFLNSQIADLVMPFGDPRLFARFARLVRRRYRLQAGFITCNFGHLAARLGKWDLKPDLLIAPFNPQGYLMFPDKESCEGKIAAFRDILIADTIETTQVVSEEDLLSYVNSRDIRKLMVLAG